MRSDYEIHEKVHSGNRSRVARATRIATGEAVVLKESAAEPGSPVALARAQREFRVASQIRSPHVVGYLDLDRDPRRAAIVEEAFGDVPLEVALAAGALRVEVALHVGVQLARALVDIHTHEVIHRAIHPGNVVVERSTWTAKIIDFADATGWHESVDPGRHSSAVSSMPLAYVSPEQTGRMSRAIDHRTDFYSLGATLYHALTGRPPFEPSDPLALVHAHLALAPAPLAEVNPAVPAQVSRVVEKLLAKEPEGRYQSARGVAADLAECLRQVRGRGEVEAFPLGRDDVFEKFLLPEKLYGRGPERAVLFDALRDACDGRKTFVTVGGEPGVGKSSLIDELRKAAVERGGQFVSGKFDPLQRRAPYFALGQAIRQLCRALLGLPGRELAVWRGRILQRLPTTAGLLADLVPDLARILGPQPPVPETGPIEGQHRFNLALAKFFAVFAGEGRPLVLFLDDLQWADPATLHALGALARLPEPAHLLVVAAYRDGELDPAGPLAAALTDLRASSVPLREIELAGLSADDVTAFVADAFHASPPVARALAERVVEKTSGNPFFVDRFLRALHEEHVLRFSPDRRAWTWDLREVEGVDITPNVVDLMTRRLARLPAPTRDALQMAACVGSGFGLDLLCGAAERSAAEMKERLVPAVREHLLVPLEPELTTALAAGGASLEAREPLQARRYRFAHDRIQQAAYAAMTEAARAEAHLRLGRVLLDETAPEGRGERIFEIVDQLNRGEQLVTDAEERTELAALNNEAAQRARGSAGYGDALEYFSWGISLLPEAAWTRRRGLAVALQLGGAECAYFAGRFEDADALSSALLPRLDTATEKAELYAIRIDIDTMRGRYRRAVGSAREALAILGHAAPRGKTPLHTALANRAWVAGALARRRPAELATLPAVADAHLTAVIKILGKMTTPAYFVDGDLLEWAVHEGLRLTLRHGATADTARIFSAYGMYLIAQRRDYRRAAVLGRLALAYAERAEGFRLRASVNHIAAISTNAHAEGHLRSSIALLRRAVEVGFESGDLHFACYASTVIPQFMFMIGEPLEAICDECEARVGAIGAFAYFGSILTLELWERGMRCLRGETSVPTSLSTDASSEEALFVQIARSMSHVRAFFVFVKTALFAIFGQTEDGVRMVLANHAFVEATLAGNVQLTEYEFYACLLLADGLRDPQAYDREQRRTMLGVLEAGRKVLARLARSAPVNFLHKDALVAAEVADLDGRFGEASLRYDEAIRTATAGGYHHHAAIATERAGRAFARRGSGHVARAHWEAARAGYLRWGAKGKVREMEEEQQDLAPFASTKSSAPLPIDMVGVVRASQALSSEISLPALVDRVLQVIVQTSGARRGALLIERDEEVQVEASLDLEGGAVARAPEGRREVADVASEEIVRYVLRTGEDVVLRHASEHGDFTRDPYVSAHGSRSVLAMAVRHRDRVKAVLFLENERATDAFSPERLEVLRLLVAQAAISLENARLYESTHELNVALQANESLLRGYLEGMPVGVLVVDPARRPVYMNRAAIEITGRTLDPKAPLGDVSATFGTYLAGSDAMYPAEKGPLTRALRGERTMVDDIELRLADRTVPLALWGTPLCGPDGAVRYAMVAFQDIGPQRAAEAVRVGLEEQLHRAERLESLGRLAGGVAHDFNNLLTPILLCSELAQSALPDDSPVRDSIEQIHGAALSAAELTHQLLSFGRRQPMAPTVLDLNELLENFVRMFRRLAREDIAVDLDLDGAIGPVRGDTSELQRVMMNLGMNAVDAMPRGGRVTFETRRVERSAGAAAPDDTGPFGPCVALRVSDTGVGIDKEALKKILESVLHDEGPRQGHRPRVAHGLRPGRAARGARHGAERAREGHHLRGLPPLPRRGARPRAGRRSCAGGRDAVRAGRGHPRRRGRPVGARSARERAPGRRVRRGRHGEPDSRRRGLRGSSGRGSTCS